MTRSKRKRYVYFFGDGKADGKAVMKDQLGGKGANLAEMTNIGLPVPPGFTISAEVSDYYTKHQKYPPSLKKEVEKNLEKVEKAIGRKFGDSKNPLLVSVRSGAAISMPGMMDTVLNLGLNKKTLEGLIEASDHPRVGWDSYRRFIQMFGNVVMGIESEQFENDLEKVKRRVGKRKNIKDVHNLSQEALNKKVPDTALDTDDLQELIDRFLKIYKKNAREDFPEDPMKQLWKAIDAVFGSWNNPRAIRYRKIHHIKGLLGTAVNIQAMVFGNLGDNSGTGVAFTRNPATGDDKLYGEYLMNAQGEDVVAGIRTPLEISTLQKQNKKVYKHLVSIRNKLEKHYKDMQDFEFTIENGKLYMLQTRTGKRTATAAVKMATDMVRKRLITKKEALMRIEPDSLKQLLHPTFDPDKEAKATPLAEGLPASPGAATGQVVFGADDAESWKEKGKQAILVRIETSPEDIGGMDAAHGILTARGGMTSHAAVVARGMGKCCVAGAGDIHVEYKKKRFKVGKTTVKQGDWISVNGSNGKVYKGQLPTREPKLTGPFKTLMKWADQMRKLGVRANADTPRDASQAVAFGAEGIGLCRTEHMFFEGDRIDKVREMIVADNEDARRKALKKLLPLQRKDFEGIYKALKGRPCTIRLLDPPLHEFVPEKTGEQKKLAKAIHLSYRKVKDRINNLHEFNPMLGHRGCRLAITYPEIAEMQVKAILEAAINVNRKGVTVKPEIMIPLVGETGEIKLLKDLVLNVAHGVFKRKRKKIPFLVGTMIEVPRAVLIADEIAKEAEFFSFGTNDLTQMTCGFSRDDAGKFLSEYVEKGVFEKDPFQVLDQSGTGKLVDMGVSLGRKERGDLKVGICGEHGGEPESIKFFHRVGLDYVSCSPFRVPIARLAAAQAAIEESQGSTP